MKISTANVSFSFQTKEDYIKRKNEAKRKNSDIEQPNPAEYQSRKHTKEERRLSYAITMF